MATKPLKQDEEADEACHRRLAEFSRSPDLVLMRDFYLLDVCWKYNTAKKKQIKRFLEHMKENLLRQLVDGWAYQGRCLTRPTVSNREGLVSDRVVRGSLGLSDPEMTEFSILEVRKGISKTATMDF